MGTTGHPQDCAQRAALECSHETLSIGNKYIGNITMK